VGAVQLDGIKTNGLGILGGLGKGLDHILNIVLVMAMERSVLLP